MNFYTIIMNFYTIIINFYNDHTVMFSLLMTFIICYSISIILIPFRISSIVSNQLKLIKYQEENIKTNTEIIFLLNVLCHMCETKFTFQNDEYNEYYKKSIKDIKNKLSQ